MRARSAVGACGGRVTAGAGTSGGGGHGRLQCGGGRWASTAAATGVGAGGGQTSVKRSPLLRLALMSAVRSPPGACSMQMQSRSAVWNESRYAITFGCTTFLRMLTSLIVDWRSLRPRPRRLTSFMTSGSPPAVGWTKKTDPNEPLPSFFSFLYEEAVDMMCPLARALGRASGWMSRVKGSPQ